MVVGVLAVRPELKGIKLKDIEIAVSQLASASKGAVKYRPDQSKIVVNTDWDEMERRVAALTGVAGAAEARTVS
jgi:hypothetical protein